MGNNLLRLLASNFLSEFRDALKPYLIVFFVAVATVAAGYAVYLAFLLAKSEDDSKRKQAKKRIYMVLSGLMIIVILTGVLANWDVGKVYDTDGIAMIRKSNYDLEESVFAYQPYGRYPLQLNFRGLGLYSEEITVDWSNPTYKTKTSKIEWDGGIEDGSWVFVHHNVPPDSENPSERYDFTATVTIKVSELVADKFKSPEYDVPGKDGSKRDLGDGTWEIKVIVPLAVLIYDPAVVVTPPPPARPQGPAQDSRYVPGSVFGGSTSGGGGNPGGSSNPGGSGDPGGSGGGSGLPPGSVTTIGGITWPVAGPTSTQPSHSNPPISTCMGSSLSGKCSKCKWAYKNNHQGVDITASGSGSSNPAIVAMQAGTIVAAGAGATKDSKCRDPNASPCPDHDGGGQGNYVIIKHTADESTGVGITYAGKKYSYYSIYMHLARNSVVATSGPVKAGDKIGNMGTTGHSTGTHLHWEVQLIMDNNKSAYSWDVYIRAMNNICPIALYV